jgi:[protein-PII] uridylyltransferase
MTDSLDLPVLEPDEVARFVESLPLAVDRGRLVEFLAGFPRRYFARTPRAEIVKHFVLMEGLRARAVISALSRDGGLWKLDIVCRDRRFLFARIAGTLSCHGLNIVSAEAFGNRSRLVLDSFRFTDPAGSLARDASRRDFQAFLERAVEGRVELEPLLRDRLGVPAAALRLELAFDAGVHPTATLLRVSGPDFLGLLYLVSRAISEAGCDIELAGVRTPGRRAQDEFYLTQRGAKLGEAARQDLEQRLRRLGEGEEQRLGSSPTQPG